MRATADELAHKSHKSNKLKNNDVNKVGGMKVCEGMSLVLVLNRDGPLTLILTDEKVFTHQTLQYNYKPCEAPIPSILDRVLCFV